MDPDPTPSLFADEPLFWGQASAAASSPSKHSFPQLDWIEFYKKLCMICLPELTRELLLAAEPRLVPFRFDLLKEYRDERSGLGILNEFRT